MGSTVRDGKKQDTNICSRAHHERRPSPLAGTDPGTERERERERCGGCLLKMTTLETKRLSGLPRVIRLRAPLMLDPEGENRVRDVV